MTIDNLQVKTITDLAHLSINDNDVTATTHTLSQILKLVDKMQAVDTKTIEPMAHPLDAVQRLRADHVTEEDQRDQLQQCAPATEKGLFLVPRVID